MDRRDALKKLGIAGATVVGASVVVSSPALAAGTLGCAANGGNPTISISKSGNASQNQASITITLLSVGGISCACSTGGATQVGNAFNWTLSGGALAPPSTWTGLGRQVYTYSFAVKVSCPDNAGIPICAIWSGGGTVTVDAGQSAPAFTAPTGSLTPLTSCA